MTASTSLSPPSPPSPPLLFPLTCIHHSSPLCYLSDLLVMFRLRPLASRNSTFVSRTTSCARRHPLERSPSHANRRYLTDEPHPRTPPLRHQNTPADLLSPKKQAEAVSGELPSTPAGPSTGYGGSGSGGAGGVRDAVLTTVFGVVVCEFASLRVNPFMYSASTYEAHSRPITVSTVSFGGVLAQMSPCRVLILGNLAKSTWWMFSGVRNLRSRDDVHVA